jgi:hypothetical protein
VLNEERYAILYDLKDVRQQMDIMNRSFQSILRK